MKPGEKLYLYPLWLRLWHGVNAVCIILLILTGISLHYSGRSFLLIDFKSAIAIHNLAGLLVSLNYLVFIAGNIVTGNGRHYRIKVQGLTNRISKQINYYLRGMFRNEDSPFPVTSKRKFNPLQKYAYILIMYVVVPLLIVSGIALLFPEIIIDKIFRVSGIMITAIVHGIMGFMVFVFLLVHLYVASLGKSPVRNYKSIITGWHY